MGAIDLAFMTNPAAERLYPELYSLLDDPPTDPHRWLPAFHCFFVWFLGIIHVELTHLKSLRTQKSPPTTSPKALVDRAFGNLGILHHFAWGSAFVASYVRAVFETSSSSAAAGHNQRTPEQERQNAHEGGEELPGQDGGEKNRLDIPTEFATGEEQLSTTPAAHPCILEMRLITSDIQNLDTLHARTPKAHYRCEVIRYARSGTSMKPWRELICELFPDHNRADEVLNTLCSAQGSRFDYFRPGAVELKFKGQTHCEAALACLFSLSKRDEDITWVNITTRIHV